MADKKDGVIPAGSMSIHDVPDDKDNTQENTDTKATETKDTKKDDSSKNYDELKKVFDKQGNELGELRKQNQELFSALKEIQQKDAKSQDTKQSAQKQAKNDDLSKVLTEYGKLDFLDDDSAPQKGADLLKQAIALTAQMSKEEALTEAEAKVRAILQEKDSDAMTNRFLEENPDFAELQAQGAFQAFKTTNPLHDDFSAYHALKADQAMAENAELKQQLEEAQSMLKVSEGDKATSKVFTKPGNEIRSYQKPKPKSVSELKQSAMEAALRAAGAA